jgi:hypothetical protein
MEWVQIFEGAATLRHYRKLYQNAFISNFAFNAGFTMLL